MPEKEGKIKVLITDDSGMTRKTIRGIAEALGCEVSEAQTADEAVKKFREEHHDIIFMDIMFPGKNGIEALSEIMSIDPDTSVVMCTSIIGQDQVIEKSIEFGAKDYITKPFKKEQIKSAIENLVQGRDEQTS